MHSSCYKNLDHFCKNDPSSSLSTNGGGKQNGNKNSQFNINVALQLGSQISYQNIKFRNRKVSEYFCVKKCANIKSSNWISVDLFKENNNNSIKNVRTRHFNGDFYNNSEVHSANYAIGWASRGLKTDKIDSVFSVPPNELYIKSMKGSNHKPSRKRVITKVKRNQSSPKNKKCRQSTLYEYLMKKHGNCSRENHQMNCAVTPNSTFNIKNGLTDNVKVTLKHEENFGQLQDENLGFKINSYNLSENKRMKNTSIKSNHSKIAASITNSAESFNNSESQNGLSAFVLDENNHTTISTEMNEVFEEHTSYLMNTKLLQNNNQSRFKRNSLCSVTYSNMRNNSIEEKEPNTSSKNTVNGKNIKKNIQEQSIFYSKLNTSFDKSELVSDIDHSERIYNKQPENKALNQNQHETGFDEHKITPMATKNPCTETAFHLLESVSSPIITDPECQEYLKDLIVQKHHLQISEAPQNNEEVIPSQNVHEEKTFYQFWENLLSQNINNNTKEFSQNMSQKSLLSEEKIQQNGSEIVNYILSQDYAASHSLMDTAMKNMNDLSQKVIEKSNSIIDNNKNSNKLLELSLKIYSQHKEKSVLSKQMLSTNKTHTQFKVVRTIENNVCSYKIIHKSDMKYDEIIPNNMTTLWAVDMSMKTLSESQEKILFGLKRICSDKSYLYDDPEDEYWNVKKNKGVILEEIKNVFEKVLKDFEAQRSPILEIPRQTYSECLGVNCRLEMKSEKNLKKIKVKYQNPSSQIKFCLIMYVLAKVLHALETNSRITRRELYYQIKHLISNQSQIDRAVKAVSYMLSVGPWDLNIVAHKGMVFGDLKIVLPSNVIDCNLPGTLIPQDVDEITEVKSSAFFILVVEKESIFYKLLEEDLPNKLVRPFIMITGKGFPDLNTQLFLKKLWIIMNIPIFILTDADPHGIHIMMTYRFGSLANAHLSRQLVIPKAKWLGVFPSEVIKFNAEKQMLTEIEKHMIQNLLKTPFIKNHKKIEEELTYMADLGYKAGIEGIIKNNNFLSEFYFSLKFHNKDLK